MRSSQHYKKMMIEYLDCFIEDKPNLLDHKMQVIQLINTFLTFNYEEKKNIDGDKIYCSMTIKYDTVMQHQIEKIIFDNTIINFDIFYYNGKPFSMEGEQLLKNILLFYVIFYYNIKHIKI